MDGLSLDQIRVFLAVVDHGSFSAAARALNRAQSAVTYAVQKLEDQIGVVLFDRASYRPGLTEAGRALLPGARRIAEDVGAFRLQAHGMAGGVEAELGLVLDPMYPMALFLDALRQLHERFPTVQPRVHVESLGAAGRLVLDGTCSLGVLVSFFVDMIGLRRIPLTTVELVAVAAPAHPLAQLAGPLPTAVLRDHVQLVLTDRSASSGDRDYGVYATRTWRMADLGAKHAMLRAGLGWGSMPHHLVAEDLQAGRLARLLPAEWDEGAGPPLLELCAAIPGDRPIGPAAKWLAERLAALSRQR